MHTHAMPIEGFVDALHDWVNAIHLDRQDRAKGDTEKLKMYARMLTENPEFQVLFSKCLDRCPQRDPKEAMNCVYAFLNAVSEASRPGALPANLL